MDYKNTFMGFKNFKDLTFSLFKSHKLRLKNLIIIVMSFTLILAMLPVLEAWVWSPLWTLIVFYVVVLWDFISAVAANNKQHGEVFITQKAKKVPVVLVAYTMLFAILHLMGKMIVAMEMEEILNPVAFDYLAKGVYFLCFSINFLSALKHMAMLGLIPKPVAAFITRFIDVHKSKVTSKVLPSEVISPEEAPSKTEGKDV